MIALTALGGTAAAQPGETMPAPPPEGPAVMPEASAPPPRAMPPQATRATFISTGEIRFDVRVDGNAACTTPCSLVVEPLRFITLHSQERSPARLSVGYMPMGDVMVSATPRANGAFAAGVTFTTFAGMGVVTGITLTAVGCSTDRAAMCNAGLITGAASGVGLYLSIQLLRSSLPKVRLGPASPYIAGNTVGLAGRF